MSAPARVPPNPPDLRQRISIETPEHVHVHLELAGLGSRTAAALVDVCVVQLGLVVLFVMLALIGARQPDAVRELGRGGGGWLLAAVYLVVNFSLLAYFALFEALGAGRTPGKRLLGLDLGTKTIGLALSDATLTIATAMGTLAKAKFTADAAEIARLVAEHDVGGIVIGLPVNMDGSEGPRAQSARQFAANLAGRVPVSIALWDERLSTAAVTRTLIEADASRRRRRALTDKLAAAYILQGALDYLARRRETAAR